MKVTKVLKDKGDFYQIYFDNKQKIRVSEDLLVRFRLLKDSEIDEETFQELKKVPDMMLGSNYQ